MASIAYPDTLPGPSGAGIQSAERRLVTPEPFEARTVQRDWLAIQQITLPPFTDDEAAAFKAWFDDTLDLGGKWFASTWPLPQGLVVAVRRWIGEPTWKKVNGFWQVSGPCEVRGRGGLPDDGCTDEMFFDLAAYTQTHGGIHYCFALDADGLLIAAPLDVVFGDYSEIRRALVMTVTRVQFRFILRTVTSLDAGGMVFFSGGTSPLFFLPRRQVTGGGDPAQRALLFANGGVHYISDTALLVDEWYSADLVINGAATITIRRESDGAVDVLTVDSVAPVAVDQLGFSVDLDGLSSNVTYAGIHIC